MLVLALGKWGLFPTTKRSNKAIKLGIGFDLE